MNKKPDPRMLEHMDILLYMDVLEEESSWEIIEDILPFSDEDFHEDLEEPEIKGDN